MKPSGLRYRVQPCRWPRTYDRIQHSNRPDFKRNNGKRKVNESIRIKFEWCKHISTSKTAYRLIHLEQWTEQSIQPRNFHEHQINKENLISVSQAKVNEHDNWNGLGIMALCRSIGPLICTKFCNWLIFFLSTGRRPPDRPGLSKSEVTRLFNSNHEIF